MIDLVDLARATNRIPGMTYEPLPLVLATTALYILYNRHADSAQRCCR